MSIISGFFEAQRRFHAQMVQDLNEAPVVARENLEYGAVYNVTHKRRGSFVGRFMGLETEESESFGTVYFATFDVLDRSPGSNLGPADSKDGKGFHAFPVALLTRADKVEEEG